MKRLFIACVSVAALAALPGVAAAAGIVDRYLLVVGANNGGRDRVRLQYAVSDAERFARVLVDLGGVPPGNEILLKDPKLRDLLQALDQLSARVVDAKRAAAATGGGRTEVVVYYSGHADEKGLLLGDDRYSYFSFRERLNQIPADVRIAVLDACASGAFIRIKGGGKTRAAFLVDESSAMRGHAFLTSSSETEAAQESDRIGASYFTHYLVSGLRGAADLSGDGRVTLNEAYQFAFDETLGRTEQSKGGPQHPSYDITMSGSGDVVMTDVRQTSATLVLDEQMAGRFFIRNARQQLVVELYKPAGRKVELGLEPGTYEVRVERDSGSFVGKTQVGDGARVVLDAGLLQKTTPEPTRRRGEDRDRLAVAGRNRVEFRFPVQSGGSSHVGSVLMYTRYLREDLALTAGLGGMTTSADFSEAQAPGTTAHYVASSSVLAVPIGMRWNPLKGDSWRWPAKPYVTVGIGPLFGWSSGTLPTGIPGFVTPGVGVEVQMGGGVDFHVAHSWSIGLNATHNWTKGLKTPGLSGSDFGLGGSEFGIGVGWLFGRGRGAPR